MARVGDLREREGGRVRHEPRLGKWIGPAEPNPSREVEGIVEGGGLLETIGGGLNAWHFRVLCDNPWNDGGGFSPREVAGWSPEQCWFRLCDREFLRGSSGRVRTKAVEDVAAMADDDGMIKGRAADGTPIAGRIGGKSFARRLMEEEEKRQKEQEASKQRRRKRKR